MFDESSLKDIDVGIDEAEDEFTQKPRETKQDAKEPCELAAKEQISAVETQSQPQFESAEPSLDECRKVLRFLSSRDVPVASYMLRTFNGFQSKQDIANLVDSIAVQSDALPDEDIQEEDGTIFSCDRLHFSLSEEYEEDQEESSDDEKYDSLSRLINEQLASYGHTYMVRSMGIDFAHGQDSYLPSLRKKNGAYTFAIPSTPVRRSHRLLQTPLKNSMSVV